MPIDTQACPPEDDELIPFLEDAAPPGGAEAPTQFWKILVADDDRDVHQATELALRDLIIEGRGLTLLHAYSGAQALEVVAATPDLAVILLDVVMESEDAGLQVVRRVRQELHRNALRIILRTGQPGYAPELETIRNYDINDYKTKSELTLVRLFTSLTSAVRAYREMEGHEIMRRGLERVVRASTELTKLRGMQLFAQGVVDQLCALLDLAPEGLICAQAGLNNGNEPARVIAAAGQFGHLIHRPLAELGLPRIQQALERCLAEGENSYEPALILHFATEAGRGLAAYVEIRRPLEDLDRHLLEVFCASMAVGFENMLLYGRLIDQAYFDPLLRIPNLNRLLELLALPAGEPEERTLALVDIDDFSAINDLLGHEFGDTVLRAAALRLAEQLPGSTLARLGSDVFGILGPAREVSAERLPMIFDEPFAVAGQRVRLSATMGLVRLTGRSKAGTELLKDAHVALKQAKLRQRGAAVYFSESIGQGARERMHLLNDLREAFESQHFFVVYQPKVDIRDGTPSGIEALLRWRMADGQLISPERFIPLAEQSGLMIALGTFVLRSACRQLVSLHAAGHHGVSMAINVSQTQLREPGFVDLLRRVLNDTGAPPDLIELEITESMAADDLNWMCALLGEIRSLGVTIAIDDFGTGFSSLSVLRHLPTQRLKIDRSFIEEMGSDDSIARMVIGLGHSQGMAVTAEGVETEAQRQALTELGCDEGQGWLFSRPLEGNALLAWLDQRRQSA